MKRIILSCVFFLQLASFFNPLMADSLFEYDGSGSGATFKVETYLGDESLNVLSQPEQVLFVDGLIIPDEAHLGQGAEIYVAVMTLPIQEYASKSTSYYKDSDGNFILWDLQFSSIEPSIVAESLQEEIRFPIFNGELSEGEHRFFVAYRLEGDSRLHYNRKPFIFIKTQSDSQPTFSIEIPDYFLGEEVVLQISVLRVYRGRTQLYTIDSLGNFQPWDLSIEGISNYYETVVTEDTESILLFGALPPGDYTVATSYLLQDGSVVFSGNSLKINVLDNQVDK